MVQRRIDVLHKAGLGSTEAQKKAALKAKEEKAAQKKAQAKAKNEAEAAKKQVKKDALKAKREQSARTLGTRTAQKHKKQAKKVSEAKHAFSPEDCLGP